jgi:hypothetical protein
MLLHPRHRALGILQLVGGAGRQTNACCVFLVIHPSLIARLVVGRTLTACSQQVMGDKQAE